MKLKTRLTEWRYWHVTRYTRKFVPWVARKLPSKLKYFVVVHGMVTVEPNLNPSDVTGVQMLNLWQAGVK
jgi:hypothetical protein